MDWETLLSDIKSNEPNHRKVEYHTNLLNLKSDNARLIIEIDRLSSELDVTVRDKGRGLNKIDTLEQTLKNYKRKFKELIGALDALERICGRCHSYCVYYRDKYENSLSEVQVLKSDEKDLIRDLEKLDAERKQIKDERDSALESAEQIQQSFIELRNQVDIKLQETELQLSNISEEKDSLISTCEQNRLEYSKVQTELNRLHGELQLRENHIKRLETQQKDFINQNRLKVQEIKRLKNDLMKFDEVTKHNKRITVYNCELRKKVERCEEELKLMKNQYEQFDAFIDSMNKNKSKKPYHRIEPNGLFSKSLNNMVEHLRDTENERKWNRELISSLEAKVSDLQFNKTSMECQLSQKSAQILQLNKQIQELSNEDKALESEFQTRSQQMEVLKDQLNKMDVLVKESQTKFQHVEYLLQLENENKIVLENEVVAMKQQIVDKSAALEDAMDKEKLLLDTFEMTKAELESSEVNFTRSEKRCNSLQSSLNEIVEATQFLKTEIQQSDEKKEEYISTLEKELHEKSMECDLFKTELTTMPEKLLNKIKTQEEAVSVKCKEELELRDKRIKSLQNELDEISSLKLGLEKELGDLKKELNDKEMTTENYVERIKQLEQTKDRLVEEFKITESDKNKEVELLNKTLDCLKEQLSTANEAVSLKEGSILLLTEEKSQAVDDERETICTFRAEIDNIVKELKDTRKKSINLQMERDEMLQNNEELMSSFKTLKLSHESLKDEMLSVQCKYSSEKNKSRSLEVKAGKLSSALKVNDSNMNCFKIEVDNYKKEVNILKEELQSFKTADYENVSSINQLKSKIQSLEEVLKRTKSELEDSLNLLAQMDAKTKEQENQYAKRVKSLEKQLEIKRDESLTKENLNAAMERQIKQLSASLKESLTSRQSLENKNKQLKEDLNRSKKMTDDLEKEITSMETDKQCSVENMSKMENQLDFYKSKCDALYSELSNIKEKYFSAKQHNLEIMTELQDKKMQLNSHNLKIKDLDELVESLSHENIEKEKRFQLIEGSLKLQVDKSRAELLETKQENGIRLEEIDRLKKKIHSLEIQSHKLTQELNRITNDLSATRTELEANKAVMNANRESLLVKDLELKKLSSKVDRARDQAKQNPTETFLPDYPSPITPDTNLGYLDYLLPSRDTEASNLPRHSIGELLNLNNLFEKISKADIKGLSEPKTPSSNDHDQFAEKVQNPASKTTQQNDQIKPKWR